MYFFAFHAFYCVCIIAEAVPDEEQAPSDEQQEDSDIVELILQLEDDQRQRQHDASTTSNWKIQISTAQRNSRFGNED